jgi:hypothetical protein
MAIVTHPAMIESGASRVVGIVDRHRRSDGRGGVTKTIPRNSTLRDWLILGFRVVAWRSGDLGTNERGEQVFASLAGIVNPPYSNGYMIFTCTPRNPFVESVH